MVELTEKVNIVNDNPESLVTDREVNKIHR